MAFFSKKIQEEKLRNIYGKDADEYQAINNSFKKNRECWDEKEQTYVIRPGLTKQAVQDLQAIQGRLLDKYEKKEGPDTLPYDQPSYKNDSLEGEQRFATKGKYFTNLPQRLGIDKKGNIRLGNGASLKDKLLNLFS